MDFSLFNELPEFLSHLKNWVSFLSDVIDMLPSFFITLISVIFISVVVIGVFIFIIKLIG